MKRLLVLLAAAASLMAGPAAGQDRLVLRLDPQVGFSVRAGKLGARDARAAAALQQWLAGVPQARFRRALTASEQSVAALQQRAARRTALALPDLDAYFVLELPAGADVRSVLRSARALPFVQTAYVQPPPAPLPVDLAPPTPDLTQRQFYLGSPPTGLNARALWSETGARGRGVTVADIEYGWRYDHEEVSEHSIAMPAGPGSPFTEPEHGTAVLSILAARDNGYGVTGFAQEVGLMTVGVCTTSEDDCAGSVADAITVAAQHLEAGDVILLEQQTYAEATAAACQAEFLEEFGDGRTYGLLPVEHYDLERDAIRLAVQAGIIVVEAAGNGACNLDAPEFGSRYSRQNDSGALMIGAGSSQLAALGFSNRGQRIDVHAPGNGVVSAGYGPDIRTQGCGVFEIDDPRQYYTACFGGTSSASAIVSGGIALLQSALLEQDLPLLDPEELRRVLVRTGTPQTQANVGRIGPRPDLLAALREFEDEDKGGGCGTIGPAGPSGGGDGLGRGLLALGVGLALHLQRRRRPAGLKAS
jgi:subtilisin family serine protease